MTLSRQRSQKGMTLLELMIAVAIIGVLASVAIPSFRNYQFMSKTTEARSNLAALARAQKAYYSEYNTYVDVVAEPFATSGVPAGTEKRDMAPIAVGFAVVGWVPEGNVFYDYDTHTPGGPAGALCACPPGSCFTASAYGNLDGNANPAVFSYAQPDPAGNMCDPGLIGSAPLRPNEPLHDIATGRF